MKITRKRKLRRHLNFYCNNYGFRRPFQILIDGTICHAALKNHISIKDQLPAYFEGEVKLLTTQCVVIETEKLGGVTYGAMVIIKQFGIHKCGHDKPIAASSCLKSMLGSHNKNRYILATQDRELQAAAREIPGTPLLYLHLKTPTLEQPSEVSVNAVSSQSRTALTLSTHEQNTLKHFKKVILGVEDIPQVKKRKKKRGPNPLSCKKKKVMSKGNNSSNKRDTDEEKKKTRKRKRNKVKRLQE